jgi:hypothetical protein
MNDCAFVGAGDADYFEYAALSVLFVRAPNEVEQARLLASLPPPLSAHFDGERASLRSAYCVRAAIVACYGGGKRARGDVRTMGRQKAVAAFNRDSSAGSTKRTRSRPCGWRCASPTGTRRVRRSSPAYTAGVRNFDACGGLRCRDLKGLSGERR